MQIYFQEITPIIIRYRTGYTKEAYLDGACIHQILWRKLKLVRTWGQLRKDDVKPNIMSRRFAWSQRRFFSACWKWELSGDISRRNSFSKPIRCCTCGWKTIWKWPTQFASSSYKVVVLHYDILSNPTDELFYPCETYHEFRGVLNAGCKWNLLRLNESGWTIWVKCAYLTKENRGVWQSRNLAIGTDDKEDIHILMAGIIIRACNMKHERTFSNRFTTLMNLESQLLQRTVWTNISTPES